MRKSGILRKGLAVALAAVMVFGTPIAVGTNVVVSKAEVVVPTPIANFDFIGSKKADTSERKLGDLSLEEGKASGAAFTNDGLKLTNGWISLPDTIFTGKNEEDGDALDFSQGFSVSLLYSKQTSDWSDLEWSEHLFNFSNVQSDKNTTTASEADTDKSIGLSYNGNVGTGKNPYVGDGSWLDGAFGGQLGKDEFHEVTLTYSVNNGVVLYIDGLRVKSSKGIKTVTASLSAEDIKKFTCNTIGRRRDGFWAMWSFCTIKNFKVYDEVLSNAQVYKMATEEDVLYYSDYSSEKVSDYWEVSNANALSSIIESGKYFQFKNNQGSTGQFSAYSSFGLSDISGNYIVTMDGKMSAGNSGSAANETQIALTNQACTASNGKLGSGYLWSLEVPRSSTEYTLLDSAGNPVNKFSMANDSELTIITEVFNKLKCAKVTVKDKTAKKEYVSFVNIGNGSVKGIYVAAGKTTGTVTVGNIAVLSSADVEVNFTENLYDDISSYRTEGNITCPTSSGKVFAGWYSDSTCENPITEDVTTGVAYAKFLDSSFLTDIDPSDEVTSVACQKSKANTGYYRILLGVDSLDYSSVGFSVTYNDKTIDSGALTTVYNSITADDVTYTAAGIWGDNGAKYIVPCVVKGISSGSFEVTPYWITKDGTKVEGATRTINV